MPAASSFSKLTAKFEKTCQTFYGLSYINSERSTQKMLLQQKSQTVFLCKGFIRLLRNY